MTRASGEISRHGSSALATMSPRSLVERAASPTFQSDSLSSPARSRAPKSVTCSDGRGGRGSETGGVATDGSVSPLAHSRALDELRQELRDARVTVACDDDDEESIRLEHRERVRLLERRLAKMEEAEALGLSASPSTEAFQSWLAEMVAKQPESSEGREFFGQVLHGAQVANAPPPVKQRIVAREAIERRKKERESRRRWPGWPRPPWRGSGADAPWELDWTAKLKNSSPLVTGMIINCACFVISLTPQESDLHAMHRTHARACSCLLISLALTYPRNL